MSKVSEIQALRGDKKNRLVKLLAHGAEPGRAYEIVVEPGENVDPTEYSAYGRLAATLLADEIRKIDPLPVVDKEPVITRELLAMHANRALQIAAADENIRSVAAMADTVRALAGVENDTSDSGLPPVTVEFTK